MTDGFKGEGGLDVQGLEFRNNRLAIRFEGKDVTQLERIKQRIETAAAWAVELGSVQAGGDRVTAQLSLGRPAT